MVRIAGSGSKTRAQLGVPEGIPAKLSGQTYEKCYEQFCSLWGFLLKLPGDEVFGEIDKLFVAHGSFNITKRVAEAFGVDRKMAIRCWGAYKRVMKFRNGVDSRRPGPEPVDLSRFKVAAVQIKRIQDLRQEEIRLEERLKKVKADLDLLRPVENLALQLEKATRTMNPDFTPANGEVVHAKAAP